MNLYNIDSMMGKEVILRKKKYTIESYILSRDVHQIEKILLKLKLVKGSSDVTNYIPTTHFESGEALTNDAQLLEFVAKCNKDYHIALSEALQKDAQLKEQERLVQKQKEEEARIQRQKYLEQEAKQGDEQGKEDARAKVNTLYKLFTSLNGRDISKAERFSKTFRNHYVIAYEHEKEVMKQEKLVASRSNYDTLDNYPGDIDELITWMKKNLLRIDVFAPTDKIANEQMAVDKGLNDRDGTNYRVKVRAGQFIAYEAFFKNPTTAPKEFLEWEVSKHDYTTSDLNARVMSHPMNVNTGHMTCNSIVKQLVYSEDYKFNVGKYLRKN